MAIYDTSIEYILNDTSEYYKICYHLDTNKFIQIVFIVVF